MSETTEKVVLGALDTALAKLDALTTERDALRAALEMVAEVCVCESADEDSPSLAASVRQALAGKPSKDGE